MPRKPRRRKQWYRDLTPDQPELSQNERWLLGLLREPRDIDTLAIMMDLSCQGVRKNLKKLGAKTSIVSYRRAGVRYYAWGPAFDQFLAEHPAPWHEEWMEYT